MVELARVVFMVMTCVNDCNPKIIGNYEGGSKPVVFLDEFSKFEAEEKS